MSGGQMHQFKVRHAGQPGAATKAVEERLGGAAITAASPAMATGQTASAFKSGHQHLAKVGGVGLSTTNSNNNNTAPVAEVPAQPQAPVEVEAEAPATATHYAAAEEEEDDFLTTLQKDFSAILFQVDFHNGGKYGASHEIVVLVAKPDVPAHCISNNVLVYADAGSKGLGRSLFASKGSARHVEIETLLRAAHEEFKSTYGTKQLGKWQNKSVTPNKLAIVNATMFKNKIGTYGVRIDGLLDTESLNNKTVEQAGEVSEVGYAAFIHPSGSRARDLYVRGGANARNLAIIEAGIGQQESNDATFKAKVQDDRTLVHVCDMRTIFIMRNLIDLMAAYKNEQMSRYRDEVVEKLMNCTSSGMEIGDRLTKTFACLAEAGHGNLFRFEGSAGWFSFPNDFFAAAMAVYNAQAKTLVTFKPENFGITATYLGDTDGDASATLALEVAVEYQIAAGFYNIVPLAGGE